jgi:cobalt/nickel transport system permease protein
MHIEPGLLAQTKVIAANTAALAVLASQAPALLRRPTLWLRTGLAALFFTLFMQAFHMPVGPSELHFIGAMPIYLLLGFLPTLFGFALGLGLQGLLFEPQDLVHLGVNALSLMVPLIVLHKTLGQRLNSASLNAAQILKLDGVYYAGVTLMVGFWLTQSSDAFALADWARFAASYLGVVALEPLFTLGLVRGVRGQAVLPRWATACLDERLTGARA